MEQALKQEHRVRISSILPLSPSEHVSRAVEITPAEFRLASLFKRAKHLIMTMRFP